MQRLIILCIAFIAVSYCHCIYAQDVQLDLTHIDTGEVIVKTVATVDTASTDTLIEVAVGSAQTIEIQMKYEETPHSLVRFDVDAQGSISNVEWKADLKDSTEYTPLDTGLYMLASGSGGMELELEACGIEIDLREVDYDGFQLQYVDPVSGEATSYDGWEGTGTYNLFPGNYRLISSASNASIDFLVNGECFVEDNVLWKMGLEVEGEKVPMHIDFYVAGQGLLRLLGFAVDVRMNVDEGLMAHLVDFLPDEKDLTDDVSNMARVTPGEYVISLWNGDEENTRLRFTMLNQTGRLAPKVSWRDMDGVHTGEEMVELEPGIVYLTPEKLYSPGIWPPMALDAEATLPYAVLKDKLDAGYYLAIGGELKLRYDERYNESTDLNLRILDENNSEVALSNPVARQYGTNWISLQLPSNDFNQGEYYVLEVRSERGDLTMLRFRYE
jgi:hypothetical protein